MNDNNNNNNNEYDYEYGHHFNNNDYIKASDDKIKIRNKSVAQKIDDDNYKDVMRPIERVISKQQQSTSTSRSQSQQKASLTNIPTTATRAANRTARAAFKTTTTIAGKKEDRPSKQQQQNQSADSFDCVGEQGLSHLILVEALEKVHLEMENMSTERKPEKEHYELEINNNNKQKQTQLPDGGKKEFFSCEDEASFEGGKVPLNKQEAGPEVKDNKSSHSISDVEGGCKESEDDNKEKVSPVAEAIKENLEEAAPSEQQVEKEDSDKNKQQEGKEEEEEASKDSDMAHSEATFEEIENNSNLINNNKLIVDNNNDTTNDCRQHGQPQEASDELDNKRNGHNKLHEEKNEPHEQEREEQSYLELDESLHDDYCQVVENLADQKRQKRDKCDGKSSDKSEPQKQQLESTLDNKMDETCSSPPWTAFSETSPPSSPISPSQSYEDNISRTLSSTRSCSEVNQQERDDDGDIKEYEEGQHQQVDEDEEQHTEELQEGEEDEEDFCGETASSSTLRRIKMSTFEDVMVCEQNKQSLESARRLFDSLVKKQLEQREQLKNGRASAPLMRMLNESQLQQEQRDGRFKKTGSLSSDEGVVTATAMDVSQESPSSSSRLEDPYDIKIVRRSGSSASCASNFRQTLVCSVSPTNQLNGSNSDLISQQQQLINNQTELILEHPLYPMDGEEILQCRAAFRENKRIIQEQQERVNRMEQQELMLHQTIATNTNDVRFESQTKTCSHCKQRLYPVDKMELDFTKTTLNIHRNCFKCQICSSMLRLETYAAMDAKLYCPAHVKCVTPSR